jgi:DNA-binding transcriptional regulator YhcF (GntR family)
MVGQGVKYNTISDILNKINNAGIVKSARTPKVFINKQYMFSFEDGGWNTVWAKTKRGAIKAALKEYKNSDTLTVNVDSVHLATKRGLDSAMSLFH